MKKILSLILALIMLFSLVACANDEVSGNKIPDIFGINYTDATEILKADGYEVSAVETDVEGISEKLLYPLNNVKKGTVFKVDDYILDGDGNITQNYDILYDGKLVSEDKSVVIYYAKTDYISNKDENNSTSKEENPTKVESNNSSTPIETSSKKEEKPSSSSKENKSDNNKIGSDFKSAMDSYEDFMNDYVSFMKKYSANPTDMSLLTDYAKYISDYSDFIADFEKWEDEDLNSAELDYYIKVQTRVSKKLLEIAN